MQHDRLRTSCDVHDLPRPDVNVVHVPRTMPTQLSAAAHNHCTMHRDAPRRLHVGTDVVFLLAERWRGPGARRFKLNRTPT